MPQNDIIKQLAPTVDLHYYMNFIHILLFRMLLTSQESGFVEAFRDDNFLVGCAASKFQWNDKNIIYILYICYFGRHESTDPQLYDVGKVGSNCKQMAPSPEENLCGIYNKLLHI